MGECPDWYSVILASDRLHCPPWELLSRSVYWIDVALAARKAEAAKHKNEPVPR